MKMLCLHTGALCWLGLGLLAAFSAEISAQGPVVTTAAVVDLEMAPVMWAPGTVVSRNDAKIAAEVSGRITWIAEAGAYLAVGDLIATIDPRPFELDLAQREAEIAQLQATLVYNNQQLQRLALLADQNSTSKTSLDEITAGRNVVQHQLTRAKVARDRTLYDLQRARVSAPSGGQWVERHQQAGEYASVGASLGRLVDIEHKEVRARAPIAVAPFVSDGQSLRVKQRDLVVLYPLRAIIPVGDELSRSLELRIPVDSEHLLVGAAVRVAVPSAALAQVLAVPRDALVIRREQTYVFRLVAGVAEQVMVSLGSAKDSYIAVYGELASGDRVVVRGAERLRNGQQVTVLKNL